MVHCTAVTIIRYTLCRTPSLNVALTDEVPAASTTAAMQAAHAAAAGRSSGQHDAAASTAGVHADLFAGHKPAQLAGLHAVNMFFVRTAFDLLRSQRFLDKVCA